MSISSVREINVAQLKTLFLTNKHIGYGATLISNHSIQAQFCMEISQLHNRDISHKP